MAPSSKWLSQRQFFNQITLIAQIGNLNALQARQDGNLAAMMKVVGQDAPDRPLARNGIPFPQRKLVAPPSIVDAHQ
jgi:hypothetical protein